MKKIHSTLKRRSPSSRQIRANKQGHRIQPKITRHSIYYFWLLHFSFPRLQVKEGRNYNLGHQTATYIKAFKAAGDWLCAEFQREVSLQHFLSKWQTNMQLRNHVETIVEASQSPVSGLDRMQHLSQITYNASSITVLTENVMVMG